MQGSTGRRHIPSLTRRPQQRKNSFSSPTANGSNFLMIFYNGECQWNITPITCPTGYSFNIMASKPALLEWKKNNVHKPFGRSAEKKGTQRNRGQGRTVSSNRSTWSVRYSEEICCIHESPARYFEAPQKLFQLGHCAARNRDPLKLPQEKVCFRPGVGKLLRARTAPGPGFPRCLHPPACWRVSFHTCFLLSISFLSFHMVFSFITLAAMWLQSAMDPTLSNDILSAFASGAKHFLGFLHLNSQDRESDCFHLFLWAKIYVIVQTTDRPPWGSGRAQAPISVAPGVGYWVKLDYLGLPQVFCRGCAQTGTGMTVTQALNQAGQQCAWTSMWEPNVKFSRILRALC